MSPVGLGFRPTDEELVDRYLKSKIQGTAFHEGIIPEVDAYILDPWVIPYCCFIRSDVQTYYGPEWFFFSPLHEYGNRNQVRRTTNGGSWKSTGQDCKIKRGATKEVIGIKKTLVFHVDGCNTGWIIHEYRARMAALPANETYVLCRLKKKKRSDFPRQNNLHDMLHELLSNQENRPMNMDVDHSSTVGYGFRPTDEELVDHYLKSKILGTESHEDIIPDLDAYKMDHWHIPASCFLLLEKPTYGSEYFFFSPLHKKFPNSNRVWRTTKAAYWAKTGPNRKIKGEATEEVIGTKKTFVLKMRGDRKRGVADVNTGWVIHEYSACMDSAPANV